MFKIMIVEDDKKLRSEIKQSLEKYGFSVFCTEDFTDIEHEFEVKHPHLVILDINLPYLDGFHLCRVLRRKSNIPIIIVSARNSDMEQIMGIELGADDYVTKPFSIEILIVKVKSSLRRIYGEYAESSIPKNHLFAGGLTLDESSFKIHYKNQTVELNKNEFRIVKKFMENQNKVLSREELLVDLWDDRNFVDDNTLTVNITRVKNKLESIGIFNTIRTIRGSGYIFDTSSFEGKENE